MLRRKILGLVVLSGLVGCAGEPTEEAGSSEAAVGSSRCGNPRPELSVCVSSGTIPGATFASLSLYNRATGDRMDIREPETRFNVDGAGTTWYSGAGEYRGVYMALWLSVMNNGTAQVFYTNQPG